MNRKIFKNISVDDNSSDVLFVISGVSCQKLYSFDNFFSLFIQNRLLRSAKYYLDKDRKDKFQAHGIDNKCASLENTSAGLHFAKDVVKVEKK